MDASKTRIWNRSALGLPQPEAPSPTATVTATPEPPAITLRPRQPPQASAVRPPPLQATRVFPIEQLLPAAAARPAQRRARRFAGHALLGLLTLLAVAAWQLPPLTRNIRTTHLESARAATQPARSVPASELLEPRPAALPAQRVPPTPGLERRAVDLVIAGDYAAARAAYQSLARERGAPVFSEAARILRGKESH